MEQNRGLNLKSASLWPLTEHIFYCLCQQNDYFPDALE